MELRPIIWQESTWNMTCWLQGSAQPGLAQPSEHGWTPEWDWKLKKVGIQWSVFYETITLLSVQSGIIRQDGFGLEWVNMLTSVDIVNNKEQT